MNKSNAKDFLPLVQALADGRTVEVRRYSSGPEWVKQEDYIFNRDPEDYRVKPEPREFFLEPNSLTVDGYYVRAEPGPKTIRVREILD